MVRIIKIQGVRNISKFENYVTASLVDIAYFEKAIGDTVILSLESDINLKNEENKKWINDLLNEALIECQELSAKLVFQ